MTRSCSGRWSPGPTAFASSRSPALWRRLWLPRHPNNVEAIRRAPRTRPGWITFQLGLIVFALTSLALWQALRFFTEGITFTDVGTVLLLGLATLIRVIVLIALATVVWVPIGVWVGTRPHATIVVQPIAQFLAAFP